jgi:hypothetical protein
VHPQRKDASEEIAAAASRLGGDYDGSETSFGEQAV